MTKHKSLILILALLISFTSIPAYCQIDVSGTAVTSYVWRGFDALNKGPAFQPSLTYTLGETGFSANVWGSWALTQRSNAAIRDLDELDLTVAYERSFNTVNLGLGYIYYGFPSMDDYPDENSTNSEINFSLTMEDLPWTPGISVFYALNDKSWDGMYINLSGSKTLETDAADMNLTISLGYSDQSLVTNVADAGISDINLCLDTTLECCGLSWTPSFTATYVPIEEICADKLLFWGGLTVGFSK